MKNHYNPETKFPIQIHKNVFILGNYFINLCLVTGNRYSALFEVGISGVVDSVIKQLEQLGVRPDFIIPSHPHSDHITGLPGLIKKYPHARIMAAKGAREFIEHPKAGPLLVKEDAFMSKRLAAFHIMPGRPPLEKVPDLSGSFAIQDKHSLDLGGIRLDLAMAFGHSPGNLMGMLETEKILFCSDSIGFHFPGREFLPLFFTGADAYLSTLHLIREWNPSIICPAHQGPLMGETASAGIQKTLDTTVKAIKRIRNSLLSQEALAEKLFRENYKDEFTLYTPENIKNCSILLVKRVADMKTDLIVPYS